MVRIFISLLLLMISASVAAVTQVTSTIDKNPVVVNESFVLEVIANDDVNANALDTSPLLNNFIVGSTSVSRQTQMVNFKTSRETKWTVLLIAKNEGRFVIPTFNIAGVESNPIDVNVVAANANTGVTNDLYIETNISATSVYLQQQLTMKVKLYFAKELKRGSLSEPQLDDANIQQIGKDSESVEVINGVRYRVIERNYTLSPQKSGNFIIKAPVFTGEVFDQNRRSVFSNFSQGKPVSVVGNDINLTVKPVPTSFYGQWLPSEIVTLTEAWQTKDDTFKVGEPITRTLTLTAAGLANEQLPELNFDVPAQIKVYPEQANSQTSIRNNLLISQKVKNFAIVISEPGTYTFPEMKVPWWNTVTNKQEYATLPSKTIKVLPSDLSGQPQPIEPKVAAPVETAANVQIIEKPHWLQWLFLAGWILTALAWLVSHKKGKSPINTAPLKAKPSRTDFIKACENNESKQALQAIIPWANTVFGPTQFTQLAQVSSYIDNEEFDQLVAELQACCYSKNPQQWQGKSLANLCRNLNKSMQSKQNNAMLNLNPTM